MKRLFFSHFHWVLVTLMQVHFHDEHGTQRRYKVDFAGFKISYEQEYLHYTGQIPRIIIKSQISSFLEPISLPILVYHPPPIPKKMKATGPKRTQPPTN